MSSLDKGTYNIDLDRGILIEIGGEYGKYNTLPLDGLIALGQNLQKLINVIAKVDLESDVMVDLKNFKIELAGYFKNSAVPAFIFTPRVQLTIGDGVAQQRKIINDKIDVLMNVSNGGDYLLLNNIYKIPNQRSPVVGALYDFAHSCGDSPISIVYEDGGVYHKKYKVSAFKKEVRDRLTVDVITELESPKEEVVAGLVKLITTGKIVRKRTIEAFPSKRVTLSYAPEVIVYKGKVYNLRNALSCSFEKIDNYYSIKNEVLGIIGVGETEFEAEESFSEEFDFINKRYNELNENELTERIKFIMTFLNYLVISEE